MCVCICICTYECMYVCMCVCMCVYMYVCCVCVVLIPIHLSVAFFCYYSKRVTRNELFADVAPHLQAQCFRAVDGGPGSGHGWLASDRAASVVAQTTAEGAVGTP